MPRMSISIPDDIRKDMEEFIDEVNWSAIASAAFTVKIKELREQAERRAMYHKVAREICEATSTHSNGTNWPDIAADAFVAEVARLQDKP